MPILDEGILERDYFIIAGKDPNEPRWGKIERVVGLISGEENGARITFRHFSYQLTHHERGVLKTKRKGFSRGAQPWSRKTAYQRSMSFLSEFDANVPSGQ